MTMRTGAAGKAAQKTQRELEDLQLVLRARNGNNAALDALIRRYTTFVRLKASSYFLAGGDGDDRARDQLIQRYTGFVRMKASSYFIAGGEGEDLIQEGLIGLCKAVRDFRADKETSFRSFAELCVTRQIITAIKTATRQKHGPLNNYVSFERPVGGDDDGERVLGDVIPTVAISDPADLVISAERIRALQQHFDAVLSDLETEVLRLYVEGKSYQEIAERLQRHVKSIDNALQRIKKKLEGHLRAREVADAG